MSPPVPVSWRVHREVVVVAGWGRAILLQLAHPLVAQGVADHSGVLRGAPDGLGRFRRTLSAMLAMTFGPDDRARRAAAGINAIHDRVHGRLAAPAGRFPSGHRYSAHDPDLLTWVHATLVESHLIVYRRLAGPLSPEEGDRYCAETSAAEAALGIPAGRLPRSEGVLGAYLAAMLASGDIAVTETARRLAAVVLGPSFPWPLGRPLAVAGRWLTAGLLPAAIRKDYGLPWSAGRERALALATGALRRALPLVPPSARYWPEARRACRLGRPPGFSAC